MSTMTAEQAIQIGRADYRTLQTVTVLTIEGREVFVTAKGAVLEPCHRCYEHGTIYAFAHVFEGVCFACTGRGYGKNLGTVERPPRRSSAATRLPARRSRQGCRRVCRVRRRPRGQVRRVGRGQPRGRRRAGHPLRRRSHARGRTAQQHEAPTTTTSPACPRRAHPD